jgi:hypothetical protein
MNDDQGARERIFLDRMSILSLLCSVEAFPALGRRPLLLKRRTTIVCDRRSIGAPERGSNRSPPSLIWRPKCFDSVRH